jgi:hypothetical protein
MWGRKVRKVLRVNKVQKVTWVRRDRWALKVLQA